VAQVSLRLTRLVGVLTVRKRLLQVFWWFRVGFMAYVSCFWGGLFINHPFKFFHAGWCGLGWFSSISPVGAMCGFLLRQKDGQGG